MKLVNQIVYFLVLLRIGECWATCDLDCNSSIGGKLYPESFIVFGSYEGRLFTVGNVVVLVAKFADSLCYLPDPSELDPSCRPYLSVRMRNVEGNCLEVPAASRAELENQFGFSFSEDYALETNSQNYKHWAFPLYIVSGMSTSRLSLVGMQIPTSCNTEQYQFENSNLITESIGFRPTVRIDTQTATIVSLNTGKASGRYTLGTTIDIVLEFDKDVVLSLLPDQYSQTYFSDSGSSKIPYGVPYLELNSNALVPLRGYDTVKSKRKISFLYQVGAGEETPPGQPLDVVAGTSIELNGGTILAEGTGLDVNMSSMPLPGGEGSLSHPTASKIFITKTGEKFPPLKYNADINPDASDNSLDRRRGRDEATKLSKPTMVSVEMTVLSILELDEGTQQFRADFMLTSRWTDHRLRNTDAPLVVDYDASVLESGRIWSPRLRLANRRGTAPRGGTDSSVQVYNTGRVVATQRHVATLSSDIDLRDFPFDTQHLQWVITSELPREVVRFRTMPREAQANASVKLRRLADPRFALDAHREVLSVLPSVSGQRAFDVLTVSVRAARVSATSTMMLVLPAFLLFALGCLAMALDPSSDARLVVPAACAVGTMGLSHLLSSVCPPLGYPTRLHLLFFGSYCYSALQLVVNAYLCAVCRALARLREHNERIRRAVRDAAWRGGGGGLVGGVGDGPPGVGLAVGKVGNLAGSQAELEQGRKCLLDPPRVAAARHNADGQNPQPIDWGGGPVRLFWGLVVVTSENEEAWEAHVERVDWLVWGSLPPAALAFALFILGGGLTVAGRPESALMGLGR